MSINKSPRTIKFIIPILALAFIVTLIAFKPVNRQSATTMYFKYQLSTYTAAQVSSQSNWEQIDPSEACEQESDQKACSFSISVPTGDEALYLNGTHPSSRVLIDASSSGSNNFVSDVRDNVASTSIAASIENVRD